MNWNDAIRLINPNQPDNRYSGGVDETPIDVFGQVLGIYDVSWSDEFSERMKKHWVVSWLCTDTVVGLAVYFLDGEPVATSSQRCRKCDEQIDFISKEAREKTRQAVNQYTTHDDNFANLDEEISLEWFDNGPHQYELEGLR